MGKTVAVRSGARVKRIVASIAVGSLFAVGAVVGVGAPASAAIPGVAPIEQRNAQTVTSDALPTVQIDSGIVWAQVINGSTVYAGGSFSNARPAGAAPGTSLMPRSNILAYNINTGVATSFAPVINGTVKSLAVSPDGTRLYVGGSFNNVDGQTRFNLAAFDTATGQLLSSFKPAIGGSYVNAIVATNSTVYVGGLIGAAAGVTRKNLAAVSSTGALLGWAPTADLQVDTMVMAPAQDKLIVGGRFGAINGASQRGLAALDLTTGSVLPWEAPATVRNGVGEGDGKGKAGIWALTADGTAVYGTGWVFANKYVGNLEGLFAAEGDTGEIRWIADCHGDHYGVYSDGTNVYSTGHEHDCQTAGGLPQAYPAPGNMRHATVYTAAAKGTLTTSPSVNDIYADWGGYPAPAAVNWFPDWVTGTASGSGQAGWTMTGNGQYMLVGGEFTFVNGQRQQGIVRFSRTPSTGATQGPRLSGTNWTPTARSVSAGTARVSIPANWDRDDLNLTYELREQGSNTVLATATSASTFWNTPNVTLTAGGLAAGSTHTYRVTAKDGDGNTANSAWVTVTVSDAAASAYADTILDDGPSLFWRLGTSDGGADWAGSNDAVFTAGMGTTSDDALATETNGASTADGSSFGRTTSTAPMGTTFATEIWFKTDSTSGGKLLGYGDAASGNSGSYDRHVYMTNAGRIVFGVYPGRTATVQGSAAYNDNKWHHVVAQQSSAGIELFVDGQLVGSDAGATGAQAYTGYWRIGGDNIGGWPNQPSSSYFRGSLDEFAVYGSTLTPTQVQEHFQAGKGPHLPPVAAIEAQTAGLTVTAGGSGSTASGGAEVTGYSWNFGDGATSTEAVPTHKYAAPGSYDVTLTVTDSLGSTSSAATRTIVAGAPTAADASYTQRVLDDGASLFWRLGGSLGGVDWVGDNDAIFGAGTGSSSDDVYPGATDGSATFDGGAGTASTTRSTQVDAPFATEVWFNTTSTSGGKLFGMSGSTSGNSGNYDRHLYMGNDGRLTYGTYLGFTATIESSASYNDGAWHHAVAQVSSAGAQLYVDGQLVASNPGITSSEGGMRYWRLGGDNISGWPNQPSSFYFDGKLDSFAVYNKTLSATEIEDHFLMATGVATPTAQIAVTGSELSRDFDGSASTAPAGRTIASYAWDFGDGSTATGSTTSHTYGEPGTYTVTLTVLDTAGRTGIATTSVFAAAPHSAPVAQISHDETGLSVSFGAAGSTTSDGAALTGYAWEFGDGATSTQASPTHAYAAAGTYTVTLKVTDDRGAQSTAATATVTVVHADPTASFTDDVTGLSVDVDATASTASDGATLTYAWNWGDASPAGSGATATHTYSAPGDYTVTLTVTDSLGGSTQKTASITVTHADPVASFTAQASLSTVSVDAAGSSASNGATLSYSWNWGDGSPASSGATATHTYATAGTYTVTLTVTDILGASDDATREVVLTTENVVARDDFGRTSASGWGAADVGGAWSNLTSLSVSGGVGRVSLNPGQTKAPTLTGVSAADVDATVVVSSDKVANGGGMHFNYSVHKSSAGEYRLKVRTTSAGAVIASLTKLVGTAETTLATKTLSGYTFTAGAKLQLRFSVVTTGGSTALKGKVWANGTSEPSDWFVTASDATASLQAAGQVGVNTYLSGSTTNAPIVVSVDDLKVTSGAGAGPGEPHVAPVAVIGSQVSGLSVAFSAAGSQVSGGASLTGYEWSFGDGATSSQASPSHSYAVAGSYPVTLRVTDSTGAVSAVASGSVSVAHAAPVAVFTPTVSGLGVAVDAAGSSASDGASLTYAWNWGDGSAAGSGATASHTYGAAGSYTVTLTVTDSLGASTVVSQSVTVSAESFVAKDDFERSVAAGWGSALTGGAWGTAAGFSVADGVGKISLTAGQTRTNLLTGVSAQNVDARLLFSTDKLANGGGVHFNYLVHKTAAGDYRLKLRVAASGVVTVSLSKVVGTTETILLNRTLTGYTHTAGGKLQLRLQSVTAGGATTLQAKVWADGTAEPAAWLASVSDAQAELQGPGQVGVLAYLSGSTTNTPLTVTLDNLEVR